MTVIKKMNYNYRTWTVISHDRGRSFEFLSSVADVQTYAALNVAEGFCEPDIIRLQNGNLLCVMRSGGQRGKAYFTPMYSSISTDNGKTWTAPDTIFEHGVFPKVLQLHYQFFMQQVKKGLLFYIRFYREYQNQLAV